jgi:hypothetical protein
MPDERTAAATFPTERRFESPTIATPSDSTAETAIQPTFRQYPIVIQDHDSWLDSWFVKLVVVSISVVLGVFLLVLLLLLLALRRLSWIQNSTIRIELADADSTSLRVLANRLNLTGSGSGEDTFSKGGEAWVAAASVGQPEAYSPTWFAGPTLSAPARPTRVADLANSPFPTAWTGPTFADARQAAEKRRLEQEEEILRNIFDRNLQLVEKLEELRATAAA